MLFQSRLVPVDQFYTATNLTISNLAFKFGDFLCTSILYAPPNVLTELSVQAVGLRVITFFPVFSLPFSAVFVYTENLSTKTKNFGFDPKRLTTRQRVSTLYP